MGGSATDVSPQLLALPYPVGWCRVELVAVARMAEHWQRTRGQHCYLNRSLTHGTTLRVQERFTEEAGIP